MPVVGDVRIGTSGFSYKEWKRIFYPPELREGEFLSYYATRFHTVEIDSSFYRVPSLQTLEVWRETTPELFRFTLKAPQQITHRQRLKVPSEALDYFTTTASALGSRLAFIQYQLPPNLKCDIARLKAFLEVLPPALAASFEFRHPSWFVPEVIALLRDHGRILCIHDTDEGCSPMEITTATTCVRLRRTEYSAQERQEWRARFQACADAGIDVFAYIKHKDNPNAPVIALEFAEGF
jgi:uncharacterized protein YecE (DUF72 family)